LTTVVEGRAELLVPDVGPTKGPGRKGPWPFYNPVMATTRDVSVLLLQGWLRGRAEVLDGLAATGALGVRLALEVEGDLVVTLNDKNPRAVALLRENVGRNGVANAAVTSEDLNAHLATHRYDYVDVDPFGTPVPFLDAALRRVRRGGVVAATATDTAPLAGAYPRTCRRRYGATPWRGPGSREVGLRILIGYCVRVAATHDRAVRPVLAYAAHHAFKVHLAVREGASRADAALDELGFVVQDAATGLLVPASEPPRDAAFAGPLWLGALVDETLLAHAAARPYMGHATTKLLARLREEAPLPPLHYANNDMASRLRVPAAPLDRVLRALRQAGFRAARTHFADNAFKTDAPPEEVLRLYGALAGRRDGR
jgi:tRNA (guanine26-N2/guanine27-N2)-dimethyltransferase